MDKITINPNPLCASIWYFLYNLFLLLFTACPFSGAATANHHFPFYPIFCIFYSDTNYLHVLLYCVYISPLCPTSSPPTW